MSPPPGEGRGKGGRDEPRELTPQETRALLRRNWWGVLATVSHARPYAVPVAYGFDGEALFLVTRPGRKFANLLENPAACLTVVEVDEGSPAWRSAVAVGRVVWLRGFREKLAALRVIRRHVGPLRPFSPRRAADLGDVHVCRLVPDQLTGRAREGWEGVR